MFSIKREAVTLAITAGLLAATVPANAGAQAGSMGTHGNYALGDRTSVDAWPSGYLRPHPEATE